MKVTQAFKYELKPNNKQVGLFIKHCGVARFAWNWGLARRIKLFEAQKGKERYISYCTQHKELIELKKTEFSWMYDYSKCAPQIALQNLDQAYLNFYRGLKTHKNIGLPKFKKKGMHDSFGLIGRIHIYENSVKLPRIGKVRTKESTSKFRGRVLSVVVSREADRWFCSLCVEVEKPEPNPIVGDVVGIDLGLHSFAVISNGNKYEHIEAPKPLKNNIKKLKRLSRQRSRKKIGSQNRKKANIRVARLHRKIKNTRKDFLNKLTTELAKTKPVICIEDLTVSNMVRNRRVSRSISDVSWGNFRTQLEYKTKWYGSQLIVIPRFYPSSKTCHICGCVNKDLKQGDRMWICMSCGAVHERDENASDNIRNYGLNILSTESSSGSNACGESVRPLVNKAVLIESGSKFIFCK